ncbi:hypothetical protein [Sinomonas atrocyanea]|uniref:hypothetical protein n=1 Tax=Sinomonas atrocyanea TaxID=37927 RepID=UPI003D990E0F
MPAAKSRFLPLRTSARATLWSAGAAAALAVAAALTLDGGLASLALLGIGAFIASALYAVLAMSRYVVAGVAAAASALAIGAGLAFLRLIGLAWDTDPTVVTSVSSRDADPFFLGALAAGAVALTVLLGGAVWPEARRTSARSPRRPAARPGQRPGGTATRPSPGRIPAGTAARPAPVRTAVAVAPRRPSRAASSAVSPSSSRAARRSA